MSGQRMLPMGLEDFGVLRKNDYYYVDKTGMIKTLLENRSCVTLFTRPRRFGKTLNMSMLKYFFETGSDASLFDGLAIAEEKELCERYMGKYPVISVSLKEVTAGDFTDAKAMLRRTMGKEARRFQFLMDSDNLSELDRMQYRTLVTIDQTGVFTMSDEALKDSIRLLSELLEKHYGQKAVILIDEYDVPLDYAYRAGYYDEMVELIRVFFGNAVKTNSSLELAVLTGCLRISRESIFTGLNNFTVHTVKSGLYNRYFGFMDKEVREMLSYYGLDSWYEEVRDWYDGYDFCGIGMYCPWDVINFCYDLRSGNGEEPQSYWANSSSNDIVRKLIGRADDDAKAEIERLIEGGSVKKRIRQELTYRDLDSDLENLWSILFSTGYLTQRGKDQGGISELRIPNREIRWIYEEQVRDWFAEKIRTDTRSQELLCLALADGDAGAAEEVFTSLLDQMISVRDDVARTEMKEHLYHGILLGLLRGIDGWRVRSNIQSGNGYSDISIRIPKKKIGIVIELKYAEGGKFEAACEEAIRQIRDRHYEEILVEDGMTTIYHYGVACYRKRCRIVAG